MSVATPANSPLGTQQLNLDLAIKFDASISDFSGLGWASIIDAVRQMHMALLPQLYLYGGSDTGKTHLLSAICESFRDMGKSAIYLSLKDLISLEPQVLSSIENIEVIAIDDIDAIAGLAEWQEAIFHLINRSYENEQLLIFSSHVPVNQLNFELKDLVSRLAKSAVFPLPSGQDRGVRANVLNAVLDRRKWHFDSRIVAHLLDEGPVKIGAMLAVLDHIQPMFSNRARSQITKALIADAKKAIDEQTLVYEMQDIHEAASYEYRDVLDF